MSYNSQSFLMLVSYNYATLAEHKFTLHIFTAMFSVISVDAL